MTSAESWACSDGSAMTARTPGDPRTLRATPDAPITVVDAGTVPYQRAWAWQRELAARRGRDEIGDVLLLLEHPRVYTLGKRADDSNVVFTPEERDARGIEVVQVDRGGDVTYHGPGQLVGYPIFKLAGPRVVDHVRALEQINLDVLASYGLQGERVPDYTGVWIGPVKVTAIGVRVTAEYVTQHGWATNIATDLGDFEGIVPCGIDDPDRDVASLQVLGVQTSMDEAKQRTCDAVARVFGVTLETATVDALDLPEPE